MTVEEFTLLVPIHGAETRKKIHLVGMTDFLRGCYIFSLFLFHPEFHQSNRRACLKIVVCPMYVEVETGTLLLVTLSWCSIKVSIFLPPWRWGPLASKGIIATVASNPSAKTSSRGLRQCCLRLDWVDSSRGASSVVLMR